MQAYPLTEQEKKSVAKMNKQFVDTKANLENARRIADEQQNNLIAIQGAVNGMALLIAHQQGLIVTGQETVQFDENFESILVTAPEQQDQSATAGDKQ